MILTKPNTTQPRTLKADLNKFKADVVQMLVIIQRGIALLLYTPFPEGLRFKPDIFAKSFNI